MVARSHPGEKARPAGGTGRCGFAAGLCPADSAGQRRREGRHEAKAATYGDWLEARYKNKPIIWILGGDRGIDNDDQKAVRSTP